MPAVVSLSAETAYATKGNIVVPAGEPQTAAAIATAAKNRVQDVNPRFSALTLTTPTKSPS